MLLLVRAWGPGSEKLRRKLAGGYAQKISVLVMLELQYLYPQGLIEAK